jgi:hypothetical protein
MQCLDTSIKSTGTTRKIRLIKNTNSHPKRVVFLCPFLAAKNIPQKAQKIFHEGGGAN